MFNHKEVLKEGQSIPHVTFPVYENNAWHNINSTDLFANKNVIVFSLPGAFTPTCSSSHVPRYEQLYSTFAKHGIDEIICMSVNDTFVMNEWKKTQKSENIRFIPDGNGDFTREMGLLVDKSSLGFGLRSWRYAMFVKNGVIEKILIEPQKDGDPFEVSDADTMLKAIAPHAKSPVNITIFTRKGCPYCAQAKQLLSAQNLDYEELVMGRDYSDRSLRATANSTQVPQVFIDGQLIGGYDALKAELSS